MIEASGICVRLGGRDILSDVAIALRPGELSVIVGPNGAGKTTLMRVLVGDLVPSAGSVRFAGRPIGDWREADLAARRAVLPQASQLAFPFTVHEVVQLGGRVAAGDQGRAADRIAESLDLVGLAGYGPRFYQQLSGGEQQRVHLARVLCQIRQPVADGEPRWLFLDEPTSNLDIRHQFQVLSIARDHAAAGGGALAILHDLNMASLFADRIVVVSDGRIVADGPPAEVLTDALLHRVFGVRLRVNVAPLGGAPFVLPHSAMDGR
ncbi:iron complex transport system ATP-binding protein [Tepidamorphus gemmatus]|uniref:Iron complex transport system ATP-binding protein n=1 Tax=Tepidamorphus gemmatus TaxID=747076 RepID=A0A4R3MEK6_9HYPH|nr:heme ABC transporter ATP-binding protein [Tepidamorphus gemmatus]TCT10627.1 iron complex transport system ATP-binding protein [Tepidamorphus gemmatus]